jgi:tetratricopeptide (TPR) repeat protein
MPLGICTAAGVARLALAAAIATAASAAFADALTDRARALLASKDAKGAYTLLLPQEAQRAGDPEYDYLLGVAALDSGQYERAVFALERVLGVQPNNHVARAEIARAYLAMGERETARREFENVRAQSIPPEAKATIERYLAAIAASDVTQISGFVEFGVGSDSNVNSATANSQIALPALGGIVATLNPASTRRSDTFAALSGGVNVTHRLSPEWSVVGGAAGAVKLNRRATDFDTLNVDANLGGRWNRGQEAITVGAQFQTFELDWQRFRDTKGLVAQWQHSIDEARQATLFTQYSELRYPSQSIRDANRKIIGAAYAQAFSGDAAPVLFASVYGGREDETNAGVPHLGHKPIGVRIGGQVRLSAGLSAFANAAYERRKYGGPEPIFFDTRTDKQSDLGVGLSYVIYPGTTLIGQLAHTDNRSNIPLNQFKRDLATLSLRFNF